MAADPRAPLQAGRSRGAVVSPRCGLAGSWVHLRCPGLSLPARPRTGMAGHHPRHLRPIAGGGGADGPDRGRAGQSGQGRIPRQAGPRAADTAHARARDRLGGPRSTLDPPGIAILPRDRAEECPSRGAFDRRPARPELDIAGEAAPADGARRCARAPAARAWRIAPNSSGRPS